MATGFTEEKNLQRSAQPTFFSPKVRSLGGQLVLRLSLLTFRQNNLLECLVRALQWAWRLRRMSGWQRQRWW